MYSIKEVTGNLLLVKKVPIVEKQNASGLYVPQPKEKYIVCEILERGNEVTNTNLQKGVFVGVPSIILDTASTIGNNFGLPESEEVIVGLVNGDKVSQTKKIEYYLIQQYGAEIILDKIDNKD